MAHGTGARTHLDFSVSSVLAMIIGACLAQSAGSESWVARLSNGGLNLRRLGRHYFGRIEDEVRRSCPYVMRRN